MPSNFPGLPPSFFAQGGKPDVPPSLFAQAISLGASIAEWAAAGFPIADDATLSIRRTTCQKCPHWDGAQARCLKCGCYELKHWLATEKCPIGHW